ncbi:MAG: alcohol dehydrogenase [Chloroflexi bacterium]|nr:MAG: alcohol dehydrogenase [Chloroflexota bacterium]
MLAAKLYAPRDMRVEEIPEPPAPTTGQILLRVTAVGICGSDLHNYDDARIGDTVISSPVVLGHEFAGEVAAVGVDALDALEQPLRVGQRVAVDPATPCYRCEMCEQGHHNLCRRLHFHGLWPDDGALQEYLLVQARSCFALPDSLSDVAGAMLEPLGIAIHAMDLAKLKIAQSVAVIGAGTIGLLITKLARLSGADPIYAFDCFDWRAQKALEWGATQSWSVAERSAVDIIKAQTDGRGVDVVFEAAWSDESVEQAAEMLAHGGKLMLVGIPSDDSINLRHSVMRRKGLTLVMVRRMKHTYPRAIQLSTTHPDALNLDDLVSHRFPLSQAPEAFAMNIDYQDRVQKVVIEM